MKSHRNNVGLLRLIFACLVIVGHSPEMVDGNSTREPLRYLFGHATFGGVAVTGFFLLSGYLIAGSMLRTGDLLVYLKHRLLRIVPAFFVAYVLSAVIVGRIMHIDYGPYARQLITNAVFLHEPPILWNVEALPYHTVNGALWTISFEFRCYLLVGALWLMGLLERRRIILVATIVLCGLAFLTTFDDVANVIDRPTSMRLFDLLIGRPSRGIRLLATFMVGTCVYLHRAEVMPMLQKTPAAALTVLFVASLFVPHFSQVGVFVFGAGPLFYLALTLDIGFLQRINDRWDISYGTYLYGWPVAATLIYWNRSIDPWTLAAQTLAVALCLGAASWWGVEKWTKNLGSRAGRLQVV